MIPKRTGPVALALGILVACGSRTRTPAELSSAFQRDHDFRSLTGLLSHLTLGQSQAEVERLLGKPTYSPIDGQVYYATSNRETEDGTPVGLILEYRRTNPRTGQTLAMGKLESIYLGPIGE